MSESDTLIGDRQTRKLFITYNFLIITAFYRLVPGYGGKGYEISLFYHFPSYILVLGLFTVCFPIVSAVYLLYQNRKRTSLIALSPMLTLCILYTFLPQQLGYLLSRGDGMTQVGTVVDLLYTNKIPGVIYPGLHILSGSISLISGIGVVATFTVLGVVAVGMAVILIALISRFSGIYPTYALLFIPLMFFVQLLPAQFTQQVLFLLLVFCYIRYGVAYNRWRWILVIAIPAVSIWVYHPLPAVMLGGFIGLSLLSRYATEITRQIKQIDHTKLNASGGSVILLGMVIVGFLWTLRSEQVFHRGTYAALSIFQLRSAEVSATVSKESVSLLAGLGYSLIDIVRLGLLRFGDIGLLLSISMLGIVIYFWKRTDLPYQIPLILTVPIPFVSAFSAAVLAVGLVPNIQFARFLRPAMMIGPCTAAVVIAYLLRKSAMRGYMTGLLTVVCVSLVIISGASVGMINAYGTPNMISSNGYVSSDEIGGMEWFIQNKDRVLDTRTLWFGTSRYTDLLLKPPEQELRKEELKSFNSSKYRMPAHFGWPSDIGNEVGDIYFVDRIYDRKQLFVTLRARGRFTHQDFDRLRGDESANRIYSNGENRIWLIGNTT